MNRKHLIIGFTVLAALAALVVAAMVRLYSGDSAGRGQARTAPDRTDFPLLRAVPSDAALLMTFSRLQDAARVLSDSTAVFGTLFAGTGKSDARVFFRLLEGLRDEGLHTLRGAPTVVSLHYSGNLVPLLTVETGAAPADTTAGLRRLLAAADSAHLHRALLDAGSLVPADSPLSRKVLLLVSPSETIMTAAQRHLESGMSILDQPGFPQVATSATGLGTLFLSHAYVPKLFPAFLQPPYSQTAGFFATLARWSAFSLDENAPQARSLTVRVACEEGTKPFVEVLRKVPGREARMGDVLPAETVFAAGLPVGRLSAWQEAYQAYLDAAGRLDAARRKAADLKAAAGIAPDQWAARLDIREAVKAVVRTDAGLTPALFLRIGKEPEDILLKDTGALSVKALRGQVAPYAYAGFAGQVFGPLFTVPDESFFTCRDHWLVVGPEAFVTALADPSPAPLRQRWAGEGVWHLPVKDAAFQAWCSLSEFPPLVEQVFRPDMARAVRKTLSGVATEVVSLHVSGGAAEIGMEIDRLAVSKGAVYTEDRDTVVAVPSGPWTVTNSATGQTNRLSQSRNHSLTLRDENGKALWGIPFPGPVCGMVQSIDYYDNGKNQFLFASGSRLYLIDRTGRMVHPFPVDLGKAVRLGPGVYSFAEAEGLRVMVLHKDNTVGLYDLQGRPQEGWQGIAPPETVKALPELVEAGDKRLWAVRTSVQTLLYGFDGGEPLVRYTGGKMIRPDSELTVRPNGTLSFTCLDGRERSFNPNKKVKSR